MRPHCVPLVLIIALVLAVVGGQALAQTAAQPDWKERFRAHDRNGDGLIDREEFQQWMIEVFYHRDKDRKGYLILEDVQGMIAPEIFKAINRKGDGKLSLAEFLNAAFQDFEAADVDKDGTLTMEEIDDYIHRSGK